MSSSSEGELCKKGRLRRSSHVCLVGLVSAEHQSFSSSFYSGYYFNIVEQIWVIFYWRLSPL